MIMKKNDENRSKDALTITKKDLCSMRTDNVTVTRRSDATIIEEELDFSKLKKESESPDKRSNNFYDRLKEMCPDMDLENGAKLVITVKTP